MNLGLGLESLVPYVLYCGAITALVLSIFWRPIVGLYFLALLIPLQTVRYSVNSFTLGSSLVGVMLVGVALGLWRTGKSIVPRGTWAVLLGVYAGFTFASMCAGSVYLQQPLPLPGNARFAEWQEYMMMPALLVLTAAAQPTKRQMQWMIGIICFATLLLDKSFWNTVSGRDFSSYSEELHQEGGSMGYAGTNGLAAFAAQAAVFFTALGTYDRRWMARWSYYALAAFSAVCLMYSLSRGGYVAILGGCVVLGVAKQRKLLI